MAKVDCLAVSFNKFLQNQYDLIYRCLLNQGWSNGFQSFGERVG